MNDRDYYLRHIVKDEYRHKMRILLDKIFLAMKSYIIQSTDFYDPYEESLAESILNRFEEVDYIFTNGTSYGEKRITLISPLKIDKESLDLKDYINAIFIETGKRLKHRDYLGAVLNLGIERDKIGDFFPVEEGCFLVCDKNISNFLLYNLKRVERCESRVREVEFEDILPLEERWNERMITCSSMRLDVVIKEVLNLSRDEADSLIKRGFVKVNWRPENNRAFKLEGDELISVRGKGRIRIKEILGETKRGRYRVFCEFT